MNCTEPTQDVNASHFELIEEPISPALPADHVLVRAEYFSVDPYMRQLLSAPHSSPKKGEAMCGQQVGTVVASNSSSILVGQLVSFVGAWSEYGVRNAAHLRVLPEGVDAEAALSIFGLSGLTAYFGVMEIAKLQPGEFIIVSSAAGSVGSLVCMIALLLGAHPIALTSTGAKLPFLRSLGVQHAYTYSTPGAVEEIQRIAPDGVQVFFDNVGGSVVAPFRSLVGRFGRIVQCGAIASYVGMR